MTQIPENARVGFNSFGFLIQLLSRRIDAVMKTELAAHGLEVRHLAMLMSLLHKDGVNQREIGLKLDFPEYYTSRNLDGLVKEGFVERRPDPNSRRSFQIFLTPQGRKVAEKLPAIIKRVNDQFLDMLPQDDRDQLIGLLQKTVT